MKRVVTRIDCIWGNDHNISKKVDTLMSKKSQERRERHKIVRADDYFSNGIFEIARYGANTLMKSNRTPEKQQAHMDYLQRQYPAKYEAKGHAMRSI